jgi:hypothetical protein
MSPAIKYTLGRIGLFVAVALVLWPIDMNIFVKLMIAVLASAGLAYFLLRGWRDQMAQQLAASAERRRGQRERLRAALAGEDEKPREAEAVEGGTEESDAGGKRPPGDDAEPDAH